MTGRMSPPTDPWPPAASEVRDAPLRFADLAVLALMLWCIAVGGAGIGVLGYAIVRAMLLP